MMVQPTSVNRSAARFARFGAWLVAGAGLLGLSACVERREIPIAQPSLKMAQVGMKNELGMVFLTNGVIEVSMSSRTGRIVHFGFVGGENVLWTNPDVVDQKPGRWQNWGGDKLWIWPEDEWYARSDDKTWKPPGDPPSQPYTVQVMMDGIVMVSPVIDKFGVRLVREIALSPGQPVMTIVNRFDVVDRRVAGKGGPLALWTVTQIPAPKEVVATPVFSQAANGQPLPWSPVQLFADSPDPWPLPPQPSLDAPGDVVFKRPTTAGAKIGLDANKLRVRLGDVFFAQEARFAPEHLGILEPNVRAQLYTQPGNDTSGDKAAYAELEFTSPRWDVEDLEKGSLTIQWTLWRPEQQSRLPPSP
jgi:hypothetical protein